jgi:hypothetical protein
VVEKYRESLHVKLGLFLRDLKQRGDLFDRELLTPYGDGRIASSRLLILE